MTEAYPLQWPTGWPRTSAGQHDSGVQSKKKDATRAWGTRPVTFSEARDSLYEELQKLGAIQPIVSSNHPTGRYGIPMESKRRTGDDGIAVYFNFNGKPMVMACDRFESAAANMRSLALAIEALRQLDRWRRHDDGARIHWLRGPSGPEECMGNSRSPTRCDSSGNGGCIQDKGKAVAD